MIGTVGGVLHLVQQSELRGWAVTSAGPVVGSVQTVICFMSQVCDKNLSVKH